MVTALVFAGGTGTRMNTKSKPKQFLELHGKPIIIHTLEYFDKHNDVDNIAVVCIATWIDYLKEQLSRHQIKKVRWIVEGGKTGQESIYNGLKTVYQECEEPKETIIMIHDGVRPLITEKLISDCIESVYKYGSAITVTPAKETISTIDKENKISNIPDRSSIRIAKAPQCFFLEDIMRAHLKARESNKIQMVDSAMLMKHYGYELHVVEGPVENIKITTPDDFFIFRAIYEARENSQIFGL